MEYCVSVPVAGSLKSPKGWLQQDQDGYIYFVFRYHFLFRQRQSGASPMMGERFQMISSPSGHRTNVVESIAVTERVFDFDSVLTKHFASSKELVDITSRVASSLGAEGVARVGSNIKTRIKTEIEKGAIKKTEISRVEHSERTHTISISREFTENTTKTYVIPAKYQQWCLDGYLSYMDYLFVKYEDQWNWLRRRRKKFPEAVNTRGRTTHRNLINFGNQPICCVKYWKQLPTSELVEEEKYKLQVEFPDDLILDGPERTYLGYSPRPDERGVPSLYSLSEAFPRKYDKDRLAPIAA